MIALHGRESWKTPGGVTFETRFQEKHCGAGSRLWGRGPIGWHTSRPVHQKRHHARRMSFANNDAYDMHWFRNLQLARFDVRVARCKEDTFLAHAWVRGSQPQSLNFLAALLKMVCFFTPHSHFVHMRDVHKPRLYQDPLLWCFGPSTVMPFASRMHFKITENDTDR